MYQQDLLLNEARKFAMLLARLMGLKADGNVIEFNQQADELLKQEFDTTLEKLIALPTDDFAEQVRSSTYSKEKLDALGGILYIFAEPFHHDDATLTLLKKALIIFDELEQKHHYYSFNNIARKKAISNYLMQYERS